MNCEELSDAATHNNCQTTVIPYVLKKSVDDMSGICQLQIWYDLLLLIPNERVR